MVTDDVVLSKAEAKMVLASLEYLMTSDEMRRPPVPPYLHAVDVMRARLAGPAPAPRRPRCDGSNL